MYGFRGLDWRGLGVMAGWVGLGILAGIFLSACATGGKASVVGGAPKPGPPSGQSGQTGAAPPGRVMLGIDVLAGRNFDLLAGKRVGLVTNHTSVDGRGRPTRRILQQTPSVRLTRLFVPEHGLDGREPAGRKVRSRRDPLTGLPAYSLYGATRKPDRAMLAGLDMLVFDLQDIGCRSYTYVSTMALCMEACGEAGVDFVVLDRPNPLGGQRIDGPPLESKWRSFVGQLSVPYVHGMTTGELARMAHGEKWVNRRPRLHVVPMTGWRRGMIGGETRLPWVATSPNIPRRDSPVYYVATGMLGGAALADVGIGTNDPFRHAGGLGISGSILASRMRRYNMPGIRFKPYQRKGFGGVRLEIDPRSAVDLAYLDVVLLYEINRLTGGKTLSRLTGDRRDLFHKVYGSDSLYRALRGGQTPAKIASGWDRYHQRFGQARLRYLLYP